MTWHMLMTFSMGLALGSFANVIIHRLPRMVMGEQAHTTRYDLCWPASHCPHCNTTLKPWHNIPVLSYLLLRGRCAFCQHNIPLRYPLIEITTGLICLYSVERWGFNLVGLCWAYFATVLLMLSVIDWQTTLLPDDLTLTLMWSGLIASSLNWISLPLTQSLWGAVIGYASLWLVATTFERITSKEGMGAGDFKLLAALGAWLGPLALLPVVVVASLTGSVVGLYLQLTRRIQAGSYIPFGPFLASAGIAVATIGIETITDWLGRHFLHRLVP